MKVKQFIKTDDFELFVTEEGEVWQRVTYYKSTGSLFKERRWDDWRKRNLEEEINKSIKT